MSTSETIQSYFDCLGQKQGWEAFLSDAMTFACFTSPIRRAVGKDAYLEATKGFFSMITALQVRGLLVDAKKKSVRWPDTS